MGSDTSLYLRVCNVPTVPRQKIINSIDCGNCNVERIFSRLGWNNPFRYQRVGYIECLLGYQDQGHFNRRVSVEAIWFKALSFVERGVNPVEPI